MKKVISILSQCLDAILGTQSDQQTAYHRLSPNGGVAFIIIERRH